MILLYFKKTALIYRNTFIHAGHGISHTFKKEMNFKIHLLATMLVIFLGVVFRITTVEWLFVTVCCMLVLSLELLNTALENICDLVSEKYHPVIKIIKDTSAAAVLVSAAGSFITGLIIFLPKLIHLVK